MLHDLIEGRMTVKDPRLLALTAIGILLAPAALARIEPAAATAALTPLASAPPAGLSVDAKDAPFNKGFDFKFKSGTSSATVSIDPLGTRHTDTATISATGGSITLTGRYDRNDRAIEITAKRGGQEIGEFSWRVEAVLR
jgi:hypothetical protein